MTEYGIGEVCELLGVRPHVVRYWEQEVAFLAPRKDRYGRRVYTTSDLNLLFRFRYLLHESKFTLEGARNQLWKEINRRHPEVKQQIGQIRADLLLAWSRLKNHGTQPPP